MATRIFSTIKFLKSSSKTDLEITIAFAIKNFFCCRRLCKNPPLPKPKPFFVVGGCAKPHPFLSLTAKRKSSWHFCGVLVLVGYSLLTVVHFFFFFFVFCFFITILKSTSENDLDNMILLVIKDFLWRSC